MGLIKNILINPSLTRLIKQTGFKICSCIPEISSTTATLFFSFVYYMALFYIHVSHVNWTNIIQITDMRLQAMVFSLYKKEITIHSYNETNYEVKTRKSYWKMKSGYKMLSSEMSTTTLTTFVYVIHIFVPTTLLLMCILQQHSSYQT